ncbi:MAG: DUF892 family protein [Thermoleophilia bacterium]
MHRDDEKLTQKLHDYVEDAHAMETNVLAMLDSMIDTTEDAGMRQQLVRHRGETEEHRDRLARRLEAMGESPSTRKEAQTQAAAFFKGFADQVRGDKAGKNARDGYATEHMEIAAYELLERLAVMAGDVETADVARRNREDEQAMSRAIEASWDRALALTLEDDGILSRA